jgi:iron complex outermembrane recepter protein
MKKICIARLRAGAALHALTLGVALGGALLAMPAAAQDVTESAEEDSPIVVTGSRIARPEVDAAVPVTVVDSAQLLQDAAPNVSDIINELPQVGIGSTRTNSNFLTSGTGISTVNLRALGNSRTLTLVNGRRFISGFAGDSAVDLNNIPVDFIERFEVVTGGSSAVYGSDAVAGVVNFVLRDDFEGLQVRAQAGVTERGDNGRYMVSATGGKNFGDGRGNVMVNFTYDRDEGLRSRDRAFSSQDCAGLICGPNSYSSYAPQGQFALLDANGEAVAALPGGNANFSFNPDNSLAILPGYTAGAYGYNRNNDRYISTPVERYLASAKFNYEFSDAFELYGEATYARVNSNSSLEPSALQDVDVYPNATDPYGMPITNAFIPTPVADAIAAANAAGAGIDAIGFRRRQNDVFSRNNHVRRETWRGVVGARGAVTSNIDYDVSYVYGHVNDYNGSEDIDNLRYRNALDSVRVGSGNVVGVDIVCRDAAAVAAGCIPLNPFGYNTVDPRAAAYVQAAIPKSQEITNEQHVATAVLSSSSLVDLWGAGGIGAAFGVEYRFESVVDDLDELTNTGGNSGNQIPDMRGSQDVYEVFGELNVPLISGKGLFDYLGVNGAIRYSEYSTIGGVLSWNAGAEWQPVPGVRFRGRYAVSNRAPNNTELFSSPSETFATVNDPCNGITAATAGDAAAACRNIAGIADYFAANPGGTFAYTQAEVQNINGFIGGNSALQEETSKTITAGVVLTPRFAPGLSLSVDYFDITIDDAIDSITRNRIIQQCLLTGQSVFCDNVTRSAGSGKLQTVNAQLLNIASLQSRGFDAQLRYARSLNLLPDDNLSVNVNYTYLLDFKRQDDPAAEVLEDAGSFGASYSTHRASARATYAAGGTSFSWQTTFMSGGPFLKNTTISNDPAILALNDVDDYWLHNIQLSQNINDAFTMYFNVDNLFDTQPQYLPGTPYLTPTGLETSENFDLFGRRFTAGFRVRF